MSTAEQDVIAVIGGTGNLGAALARRLAHAGRQIVIGSRTAEKAQAMAEDIGHGARGMTNTDAAAKGDLLILTVPFASQAAVHEEIEPHCAGKIVCDTTVPLMPPKVMRVQLPAEGCAAIRTQQALPHARVVSAFHNVAAHELATQANVDCDVLVFGDEPAARARVVALARDAGLRGLHAGALVNSAAAEAMTSILIFVNKHYGAGGAGLRITGELTEA